MENHVQLTRVKLLTLTRIENPLLSKDILSWIQVHSENNMTVEYMYFDICDLSVRMLRLLRFTITWAIFMMYAVSMNIICHVSDGKRTIFPRFFHPRGSQWWAGGGSGGSVRQISLEQPWGKLYRPRSASLWVWFQATTIKQISK